MKERDVAVVVAFSSSWERRLTQAKRKMGDRRERDSKKSATKWPALKPKQNLQITRLKNNDLLTVQNFFSSAESMEFIKAAEAIGFAHQGSLGPTKGEAYRDNDRISVNDPVLANVIWESGLNKLFSDIKIRGKVAVGLNPNIRFYRYNIGQRFGRHIDESVDLGEGKHTHYTLLIYLNGGIKSKTKSDLLNPKGSSSDPLVGGETVFYGSRNSVVAEVSPTEGMALLHIHGDKCMLHEARNVTKGVKYLFRSDVAFS
ncbi:2-oxoglutarate (2OG) and Fe(II)-dependent oxygenase superfamily protein [Quillaja saponaria]|uniref:2-oxoglutarate (2OG) and Fe(II)-dependent oxygenase superfamily protein n=1 Tax=Quillaja saponaria TaxID=32244 RepID=A0AAD7M5I8_QUISA|nr:2-oxoglutarate (2OG) and Fe(II)-dependent oxygenase superfamily protein [Quillaja saponaria]